MVGSAIEHAAEIYGMDLDFRELFLTQEEEDVESAGLADALCAAAGAWPHPSGTFLANDLRANSAPTRRVQRAQTLREFLFPDTPPGHPVTAKAVGKRLKRHVGEPVKRGEQTLILREWRDPGGGPNAALSYYVEVK